jgi:hypothetical protein
MENDLMPIRYSSIIGGSGGTGFNIDIGSSGNTTFVFSEAQPAGGYSVTSQLADATIEFYAIAEDGTLAGYTNTKALTTTKDFTTMVVYGAVSNDLISFEFKPTTLPSGNGDQDSGAAPFITAVSDADLANIDDTTIITGGNFASDVVVTFTGTDSVVRNPKSVVRTNSTQLIVTRPDAFLEDNAPYTLEVSNPGIPQSAYRAYTSSLTAGGDPTWVTASGALASATAGESYSTTLQATDPDGGTITYSVTTGQLPTGLSLNPSTGVISGTPTEGPQTFTVAATDSGGNITNRSFTIVVGVNATGGTVVESGGYKYHTFYSSSTFSVSSAGEGSVEYLLIGGGGGGGYQVGGGGGAGGLLYGTASIIDGNSYPVVVGAPGAGAPGMQVQGSNGGNTTFSGISAIGGGRGANHDAAYSTASSGGSGGGGSGNSNTQGTAGGAGTVGQGNSGGSGFPTQWAGGGGGGATQAGANATASVGGKGGDGSSTYSTWGVATSTGELISGVRWYAGGGGGCMAGGSGSSNFSAGGKGGGGRGFGNNAQDITPGTTTGDDADANTGGGGGGIRDWYTGSNFYTRAGNGGSGIAIIRYPI